MQEAELDHLAGSRTMQAAIAENYVGLPFYGTSAAARLAVAKA
jgi:hypothetical protein